MSDQPTTDSDLLREAISPILGRIPSGVFILTAADGQGNETGMLASWVQQASFEPPAITVAVNKQRYLNEWLGSNPEIALSLIGENQFEFLKHFGKGFEPGEPAFAEIQIDRAQNGLPVLTAALGHLAGKIIGQIDAGDHIVYAVEITGADSSEVLNESKPMVHIRKNGFNY